MYVTTLSTLRRAAVLAIAWSAALLTILFERVLLPFAAAAYRWISDPANQQLIARRAGRLRDGAIRAVEAGITAALWLHSQIDWQQVIATVAGGIAVLITASRSAGAASAQLLHTTNDRLAALFSAAIAPASAAPHWFSTATSSDELSADEIALLEEMADWNLSLAMEQPCPF